MTSMLAALFTRAIELTGPQRLLLMAPLCLSIAVVYKALRMHEVTGLAREAGVLWLSILAGMVGVGLGAWALFALMV